VLLSDYISQVRNLIHDLQAVDWTDAELTTIVNSARKRVALDAHCVRTFFSGLNFVANQETYPLSGGIGGVNMTNVGSGYTSVPTVTFDAPPAGGVQATGTAVLSGTTVADVLMTNWGSGYTSVPNITFGGPGVDAAGTAIAILNILDYLSITPLWPGNSNSRMMSWLPFTTFQAWCRAYRLNTGYPQAWTNHDEMNLFFVQPIPDQPYMCEIDAIIMPSDLVNLSDSDTQLVLPFADAVQWYATYIAMIKLQNLDQAEFFSNKYKIRVREIRATRQDRRIPNIYQSSFRRMSRW
jgi:hypothetical protein